jgi:hypothetical protein
MAMASEVTWFTAEGEALPHLPLFVASTGRLCGTIPHLIAAKWGEGAIPLELGLHDVALPIPEGWRAFVSSGQRFTLLKREIYAKVKVLALAHTIEGRAEQYSLINSDTSQTEKLGIKTFYDTPEGPQMLTRFDSEPDLNAFLAARPGQRITTRIKVPKIHFLSAYWPISQRASDRLAELVRISAPPEDGFPTAAVEGLNIAAAWEPAMPMEELDRRFLDPVRARGIRPEDSSS